MFKSQYKPAQDEQEIFTIVQSMTENTNTVVQYNPRTADYVLENSENHFTVCLFSTFITLTNSTFSSRRQLESKGINALKKFAEKRLEKDVDRVIEKAQEREQNLFKRMKESLQESK